jgi:hypothetical protein
MDASSEVGAQQRRPEVFWDQIRLSDGRSFKTDFMEVPARPIF